MIQKSVRVPTDKTAAIATYFGVHGENEEVKWLLGSKEDIMLMGQAAQMCGRAYGVRHFIISPGQQMSTQDINMMIGELVREYNVPTASRDQICVTAHKKPRANTDGDFPHPHILAGLDWHYHVAVAEVDLATGRVLDSSHTYIRDEKLSRLAELRLGHEITPGRFNKEVYNALSEERPKLDLGRYLQALEEANVAAGRAREDWLEYRGYAAYSSKEHQAFNRKLDHVSEKTGVDYKSQVNLTKVKSDLRKLAAENSASNFLEAMGEKGFEARPGKKAGIYRVFLGDIELGSLGRLSRLPGEQLHEAILERNSTIGIAVQNTAKTSLTSTDGQTATVSRIDMRDGPDSP